MRQTYVEGFLLLFSLSLFSWADVDASPFSYFRDTGGESKQTVKASDDSMWGEFLFVTVKITKIRVGINRARHVFVS